MPIQLVPKSMLETLELMLDDWDWHLFELVRSEGSDPEELVRRQSAITKLKALIAELKGETK